MPLIGERYLTRPSQMDTNGTVRASREFIFDVPPNVVRGDVDYPKVRIWPGSEPLTFDSDNVTPFADGKHSRVVSLFSNDASFRFPTRLDRDNIDFNEFSITAVDRDIDIPIAKFVENAIVVAKPDGTSETRSTSQAATDRYEHRFRVWSKEITLPKTVLNFALIQFLDQQDNSLHEIPAGSGFYYRFISGDITPTAAGKFQTTYSWERDPGTVDIQPEGFSFGTLDPDKENTIVDNLVWQLATPGKFKDPLNPGDSTDYTRPPYHTVTGIPDSDPDEPEAVPPFFKLYKRYPIIGNGHGWMSLPGDPFT